MQRITGADEPAWPDTRSAPSSSGRRRRGRWIVALLVVVVAGAGVAWWVYERQTPGPATMGCATFEIVNVDLAPTSGFPTQADALHAFLATSAAAHLPHSGYSVPTQADLQAEVAASERESDVTPSVLMPTYWHKSHGKVDVQVDEEPNSNGWAVVSASACR